MKHTPDPTPMESAKRAVVISYTSKTASSDLREDPKKSPLSVDQLYVVWFAKTLQNWKALVSTDAKKGIYWEVTHNGLTGETYVDEYNKAYSSTVVGLF